MTQEPTQAQRRSSYTQWAFPEAAIAGKPGQCRLQSPWGLCYEARSKSKGRYLVQNMTEGGSSTQAKGKELRSEG